MARQLRCLGVLEVEGVRVEFGGVVAVDDVSMSAEAGTITGVIGPNGAGKTTLFDVIAGLRRPREGKVFLKGKDITTVSPIHRARRGIGRTFQRLEVFGSLSVRENIRVGVELHRGWSDSHENILDRTDEVLEQVGLVDVRNVQADQLSTGSSRMMELGRALAICPTVLLLDEPGSGLDNLEVGALAELIASIADTGMAVVLVEHDVDLVMRMCSKIWVLESGRVIASGTADDVRTNQAVVDAYLGGEANESEIEMEIETPGTREMSPVVGIRSKQRSALDDPPLEGGLDLVNVRAGYGNIEVLHGVSLRVHPGEVVALLGPNGAGKTTLLRTASGQLRLHSGNVTFDDQDVRDEVPERLVHLGLCTIPEGRGIFPNLSVAENLRMWSFAGGTDRAEIEAATFGRFPQLSARRRQLAGTLSGGEQQMLAISRALVSNPRVLLLDEISMGLAPMVVSVLYDSVGDLAANGIGILVVEQFAETALAIANRAAVMRTGHIVLSGTPQEIRDDLGKLYLGTSSD
jgi:branched-chain amino acid transport system ATP-binding protein